MAGRQEDKNLTPRVPMPEPGQVTTLVFKPTAIQHRERTQAPMPNPALDKAVEAAERVTGVVQEYQGQKKRNVADGKPEVPPEILTGRGVLRESTDRARKRNRETEEWGKKIK